MHLGRTPLRVTGYSMLSALGRGREAHLEALSTAATGLGPAPMPLPFDTAVGEVRTELPELPAELRRDTFKVQGCLSQVWFVPEDRGDQRLHWQGDSDSAIVKGLIAVLQVLYAGKSAEEVAEVDIDGIFGQIGLERHLSMNRRNGFYAMVQRLRDFAAA